MLLRGEVSLPTWAPATAAEADLAAEVAAIAYDDALADALIATDEVEARVRSLARLAELAGNVSRSRVAYAMFAPGDVRE